MNLNSFQSARYMHRAEYDLVLKTTYFPKLGVSCPRGTIFSWI